MPINRPTTAADGGRTRKEEGMWIDQAGRDPDREDDGCISLDSSFDWWVDERGGNGYEEEGPAEAMLIYS